MKILVACEFSGIVRDAFAARGHDVWSCDLLPTERPGQHIIGDVRDHLTGWDLIIAHPPCQHIAVSGARYFVQKRSDGRQQEGIDFFMEMVDAPCEKIVIENPVSIMSTIYRKPDQYIQPYQFGHPESKLTCLWIDGDLDLLIPTVVLTKLACGYWENQTPSGQNKLGPSPGRAKHRATTYKGIAAAMAERWG